MPPWRLTSSAALGLQAAIGIYLRSCWRNLGLDHHLAITRTRPNPGIAILPFSTFCCCRWAVICEAFPGNRSPTKAGGVIFQAMKKGALPNRTVNLPALLNSMVRREGRAAAQS